eukprot:146917-Rhodomonas_salina.1
MTPNGYVSDSRSNAAEVKVSEKALIGRRSVEGRASGEVGTRSGQGVGGKGHAGCCQRMGQGRVVSAVS